MVNSIENECDGTIGKRRASSEKKNSSSDIIGGPSKPKTSRGEKDLSGGTSGRKTKQLKDINAPRAPLNGYVRYLNKNRDRIKSKEPDASFAQVTKILAQEWTSLPPEEKKQYLDEAEKDKERYLKELQAYQQSDAYQAFLKKQKESQKKSAKSESQSKKSSDFSGGSVHHGNDSEMVDVSSTINMTGPSFDIPIFTEEFLDHNKLREAELRQLRKINTEYEEQNAILSKHIENMKAAIDKLEVESMHQKTTNKSLEDHLTKLKSLVVSQFSNFPIPGTTETANLENVEHYLHTLSAKVNKEKGMHKEHDVIMDKVQKIIAQID